MSNGNATSWEQPDHKVLRERAQSDPPERLGQLETLHKQVPPDGLAQPEPQELRRQLPQPAQRDPQVRQDPLESLATKWVQLDPRVCRETLEPPVGLAPQAQPVCLGVKGRREQRGPPEERDRQEQWGALESWVGQGPLDLLDPWRLTLRQPDLRVGRAQLDPEDPREAQVCKELRARLEVLLDPQVRMEHWGLLDRLDPSE